MKYKSYILLFIISILAISLSACVGVQTDWPGLSADEQSAYVAFNNHVYAVNLDDGTQKWRYPVDQDNTKTFFASPALSPDGQLIVGGYDSVLYSLNPETGGPTNWNFPDAENRYIASALAVEEGIFVAAADENLYALDQGGQLRWTFPTERESWSQPITNAECDCIYLSAMDHKVYAIDPQDGSQIWQSPELDGAIAGNPAYSEEGVLYVGTFGGKLFALNAEDGSVLWEFSTTPHPQTFLLVLETSNNGWVWSGPVLSDGILYFGDLNGYFYAIDAKNGQQIWQLTPEDLDGEIVGSPLVIEDDIYIVSQGGTLFNYDTSRKLKWERNIGAEIFTTPVSANDLILVAPKQEDKFLVAFNKEGVEQWSFPPAGE